jgi:hypothetical protein
MTERPKRARAHHRFRAESFIGQATEFDYSWSQACWSAALLKSRAECVLTARC